METFWESEAADPLQITIWIVHCLGPASFFALCLFKSIKHNTQNIKAHSRRKSKLYSTLTSPRKTPCVALMSSSLCSVTPGWMPSFWAASSTCCPDTATDSNKDDISIRSTSSSVALILLQLKYRVLGVGVFFCVWKIATSLPTAAWPHIPGGSRCQILCCLAHSPSCLLQPAEVLGVLLAVAQQHQVAYVACDGCDHPLNRHGPDQALIQERGHPAAEFRGEKSGKFHLLCYGRKGINNWYDPTLGPAILFSVS